MTRQFEAPITYKPGFLGQPDIAMETLWKRLDWVRIGSTPRREYYVNRKDGSPYTYGSGAGQRTYESMPTHPVIDLLWLGAEAAAGCEFDVCFLNGYEDQSDHLGWHADDSPEMDDSRPIAIVSLGAEREIWFQRADPERRLITPDKLRLGNGSLCLMAAGMQDTHQHRIPKAGRVVGPRISLTFRGTVPV